MTTETITAQLNSIRYQNGNGFMIGMAQSKETKDNTATFDDPKMTITYKTEFGVLGSMISPQVGMTYKLFGEWSNHPEFGRQFKFSRHEIIKPTDTNGIYKYIVRTAKWVGPTIGQRLVDLYGENTLEVLRNDPEIVASEIVGLTENRTKTIQEMLIEQEETEAIIVELLTVLDFPGLRKNLPIEIASKYGSNSLEVLKENPYILTDFNGIGFLIADRIAMHSFKVDVNSMYRIKSCIEYVMKEDLNSVGSTWMYQDKIIFNVNELTGVKSDGIEKGLKGLIEVGLVVMDNDWYSFFEVDKNESLIAGKIKEMLKGGN